jgi:hypothetical protein
VQYVNAVPAEEGVLAVITKELIVPGATIQGVVAGAAEEGVLAVTTKQLVSPTAASPPPPLSVSLPPPLISVFAALFPISVSLPVPDTRFSMLDSVSLPSPVA